MIVVEKNSYVAEELYPFKKGMNVKDYCDDLIKHAITPLHQTKDSVTVYIYGEVMEVKRLESLSIKHPAGPDSYQLEVYSMDVWTHDYEVYDGNSPLLGYDSKSDNQVFVYHPSAIQQDTLCKNLRKNEKYGLSCYGMYRNNKVISVDRIELGNKKVLLNEENFLYLVFSFQEDGKLYFDYMSESEFDSRYKMSSANIWLSGIYRGFKFPLSCRVLSSGCVWEMEDEMSAVQQYLMLQRVGFKGIRCVKEYYGDSSVSSEVYVVNSDNSEVILTALHGVWNASRAVQVKITKTNKGFAPHLIIGSFSAETYSLADNRHNEERYKKYFKKPFDKIKGDMRIVNLNISDDYIYMSDGQIVERTRVAEHCDNSYFSMVNTAPALQYKNSLINNYLVTSKEENLKKGR